MNSSCTLSEQHTCVPATEEYGGAMMPAETRLQSERLLEVQVGVTRTCCTGLVGIALVLVPLSLNNPKHMLASGINVRAFAFTLFAAYNCTSLHTQSELARGVYKLTAPSDHYCCGGLSLLVFLTGTWAHVNSPMTVIFVP